MEAVSWTSLKSQHTQRTCRLRVAAFTASSNEFLISFRASLCLSVRSLEERDSVAPIALYSTHQMLSLAFLFIASETHSVSNSITLALFSQSHSIIIRAISRRFNISLFFGHRRPPLSRIIRVWPNAAFSILTPFQRLTDSDGRRQRQELARRGVLCREGGGETDKSKKKGSLISVIYTQRYLNIRTSQQYSSRLPSVTLSHCQELYLEVAWQSTNRLCSEAIQRHAKCPQGCISHLHTAIMPLIA